MSTITREQLRERAREKVKSLEFFITQTAFADTRAELEEELELARIALASLEAEPVPEWTNEQCMEFLSIAFRHAEINGDLQLDDIRLGVKMVNGSRPAMLQGAENAESPTAMKTAPALDSSPKIAESTSGNSPVIPDGLRLALSNAGIAAPESDEMLAATCEKYIQALVTWVKDRKPFQPAAPQQEV